MLKPEERYAVFLDIDRTLLADSFIIPQRNLDAIAKARAAGHMVFINTGRSWANIPPVLFEQLNVDGVVAGSGAMIEVGGKIIYKSGMSKKLTHSLAEYFFQHPEYWCVFEGEKHVYMIESKLRASESFQILLNRPDDIERLYPDDEIQVLAMGVEAPPEFIERFKDEITVFQFGYYADCVIKGNNKAEGIKKVLKETGIRRENTIAIGDSENDRAMIEFAGIGVAMENSQQNILDIADYVTDSNMNCGVATAIEKLLNL